VPTIVPKESPGELDMVGAVGHIDEVSTLMNPSSAVDMTKESAPRRPSVCPPASAVEAVVVRIADERVVNTVRPNSRCSSTYPLARHCRSPVPRSG